jgi:DHA1 family multidrug resistance protein-like MFS transporter
VQAGGTPPARRPACPAAGKPFFTCGAFETYLPLHLQGRGLPTYQIGLIFSLQILAIVLSRPLFGRLSDRIDRRIRILFGIVFGLGLSFSTVATNTCVSDVTAEESLGASMGALSLIMDIGQSVGPFIIGVIIQASTMNLGFFVDFCVCLACAGAFAAFRMNKRKHRPA